MINIIELDKLPSEAEANRAELMFMATMDYAIEYLEKGNQSKKEIYQELVSNLAVVLLHDSNFPSNMDDIKNQLNYVYTIYLDRGMPNANDIDDYCNVVMRIILAMTNHKQMVELCKQYFMEEE